MNLGETRIELSKDKNLRVCYHVMTDEKFIKNPGDAKVKINNETIEIGSIYSD